MWSHLFHPNQFPSFELQHQAMQLRFLAQLLYLAPLGIAVYLFHGFLPKTDDAAYITPRSRS